MSTKEMKDILFEKLQDEGCYFKKSDLSVKKAGSKIRIVVKDYEHIPFEVSTEEDDWFGKMVWLVRADEDRDILEMFDSKQDFRFRDAMVYLGYYIGSRF